MQAIGRGVALEVPSSTRHLLTQRFRDPVVERAFQAEAGMRFRPQAVATVVIGARNVMRALLIALMEPPGIKSAERRGDDTARLALQEEARGLPHGAVWEEFCARYAAELEADAAQAAARTLRQQRRSGPVTLLYAASDERHNNAVALNMWLERPNTTDPTA